MTTSPSDHLCRHCTAQLQYGVRLAAELVSASNRDHATSVQAVAKFQSAVNRGDMALATSLRQVALSAIEKAKSALANADFAVAVNDQLIKYADDCIVCVLSQPGPPTLE